MISQKKFGKAYEDLFSQIQSQIAFRLFTSGSKCMESRHVWIGYPTSRSISDYALI